MTPLAAKKHRAAKVGVSKTVQAFYKRAFPGEVAAPDVFWDFVEGNMVLLNQQLQDAGENQSRINSACRKFVDLFKKACVRARKLIDAEQTRADDAEGGQDPRRGSARQALEDAKRPEDYVLWGSYLGGERAL